MTELELVVPPQIQGQRLDRYLVERVAEVSRSRLQALIDQGQVMVDDKPAKASLRLRGGERIRLTIPPAEPTTAQPEDLPLTILYEDSELAVVDKPSGMATHPAPGSPRGTLVNALLARLSGLSGIGGELRPGIVHRLDKETSGLLVVAKTDVAHRALQAQIQAKTAVRQYLALVAGRIDAAEGTIDAPIGRHPKERIKMAVVTTGRPARTHYRVLEAFRDASLVELTLETGRTHQIRVHLADSGHPVLGDRVYSHAPSPMRLSGQLLHAFRLDFDHPTTGQRMTFESSPPPEFARALDFVRRRGFWRG
ncbi:MAG: RluA family pseudouridine synthase [Cyanobacteria bacterium REEB65]|nr:RluA family pseudouridine synthase [Cyanobacteria bacterium REEB65]